MITLDHRTPLHVPDLHYFEEDGISYAVDPQAPNWIAVDRRGRELLDAIGEAPGTCTPNHLVTRYAARHQVEAGKAWMHVHDFLTALGRADMVAQHPFGTEPYPGRAALAAPEGLKELWIQVNNACNLECSHCLVFSGPGKEPGLPYELLRDLVDRAAALGLERLYLTGGEPFVRRDIFDLIRHATDGHGLEVIVLTNATVFQGRVEQGLAMVDPALVRFQVSLDGVHPETNDRIRGVGTFTRAVDGARLLGERGFDVSLSTVVAEENLEELPLFPQVVRSVGARSQHLMWAHKRGRAAVSGNGFFPDIEPIIDAVIRTVEACGELGLGRRVRRRQGISHRRPGERAAPAVR